MKRNTAGKLLRRINVLNATFIYLCCVQNYSVAYNLDVANYLSISGPNGSFFGYSVLLHENAKGKWVIAGAPVAASKFPQQTSNPGAIYKCKIPDKTCEQIHLDVRDCGKTCSPENDNQWLGVSLSRQQSSGNILACGHRWKNVFYTKKDNQNKLPHGVCYKLDADLGTYLQLIPCYKDHQREFGKNYGSCQVGISNFMTEDLIVMGAPGSFYWTGSVLVYNTSSRTMSAFLDDDGVVLHGSYLGYSVGAGHFTNPSTIEIAAGAPQHELTGKAYIFRVESNLLNILFEMTSHKLGSYFGASVCAVDLNSDGLSDLLVGAPMFSTIREEGRVYVYINQGAANMKEAEFLLTGSDSYASRFGETITSLGDIDDDGFPAVGASVAFGVALQVTPTGLPPGTVSGSDQSSGICAGLGESEDIFFKCKYFADVAIGAPQEDELRGAIYIYNGRKSGIAAAYSQKITGAVLGAHFSMFGQSVSGGVDIDNNGYPDVAVGSFLSDSAVVLRTRPVVIVEALVLLPPSINRSVPLCPDHGQLAVCSNITVCFRVQGKQIPGSIGMLYNLTADVEHREGFPNRFYFLENGTSNTTTGKVFARPNHKSCVTHTAYMRRDIRDIFSPIYFELKYELGKHSVPRERGTALPNLKPVLQQWGKEHNQVRNKTEFARYCAWVNCSTNLHVSAQLVLPHSHQNMPYFALGTGKTIMLNVTLANLGDDAFLPMLHLRLPSNLYFIKVLEAEEKHVSCESVEDDKVTVDCSVGNSFLNSLAKLSISFLLDVNQSSSAGDLNITVNATRDNVENEDLLYDNIATVTLPLRYGVDLNIHGIVSQPSFVFGGPERTDCSTKKFNYTYKVISVGPSKAVAARVQIDIPKNLAPYSYRLLNIVDLQTSVGRCYIRDPDNGSALSCDVPQPNVLEELVFFFSKITKRQMYCMKPDYLCLQVVCELGDLDVGKDATIQMEVELNPDVLQVSPGRQGIMELESTASAWPESPYAVFLTQTAFTKVVLEAHYSQRPREDLSIFIIASSLTAGLLILAVLIYVMWKAGFFRREYKEKQEAFRRESWDFVQKSSDVY